MKKVKVFLAATAVLLTAGAVLAAKAHRNAPNLFICDPTAKVCAVPPAPYSTVQSSQQVLNPPPVYTGFSGGKCSTADCRQFTGTVYLNE